MHTVLLLLLFPLTLALTLRPTTKSTTCPVLLPQDPPSTRVVNGDLLSPTLTPYLVIIPFNETDPNCSGVLISSTWFLTAAQCNVGIGETVAIGVSKMSDIGFANTRTVASLHAHPDYNFDLSSKRKFDMAAYKLSTPAPDGSKFMAVNVAERPEEGSEVRLLGYGHVATNTSGGGVGRQVDLPVTTLADCQKAYPGFIEEEYNFCAGQLQGGCGPCTGDAGAPLIQYNGNTPVVVGLASWGRGCAKAGAPAVNVRTKPFERFLDEEGVEYTKATKIGDPDDNGDDDDPNPEGDDDGNSLGVGAIIGIVVGALTVVALVILGVIFVGARRKRHDKSASPPPSTQYPEVPILPLGAAAPTSSAIPGQTPSPPPVAAQPQAVSAPMVPVVPVQHDETAAKIGSQGFAAPPPPTQPMPNVVRGQYAVQGNAGAVTPPPSGPGRGMYQGYGQLPQQP